MYLGDLKDFMWPAVNLHFQWNDLQVLCFPQTRCISLMRQPFKVHRLNDGTGSSSNLQRVSLLWSAILFTGRSVLWLPKLSFQSEKLFRSGTIHYADNCTQMEQRRRFHVLICCHYPAVSMKWWYNYSTHTYTHTAMQLSTFCQVIVYLTDMTL